MPACLEMDDSLSLVASDAKELSGSVTDPALSPLSSSCNSRLRIDEELIRIMTKAVNELGLKWSPPEELSRSRLDKWFSRGAIKPPANAHPPSSLKFTTSSLNRGAPLLEVCMGSKLKPEPGPYPRSSDPTRPEWHS